MATSGYTDCACRDCFEIAISDDGSAVLCGDCQDAGCTGEGECQSPGAYGGDCEHDITTGDVLVRLSLVQAALADYFRADGARGMS